MGTTEAMTPPVATRTCVIASTPWSGGQRLSLIFGRTGAMPRPVAWFDPIQVPQRGRRLGLSIHEPEWLARYLEGVESRASSDGTASFMVMWTHFRWLVQIARSALGESADGQHRLDTDIVAAWFPNPTYVWVRSKEAGRQALRWYLDRHPEIAGTPDEQPGRVDFQEVRWLEAMVESHDRGWSTFFAIHGLQPTTVYHEDLADWTVATLRSVLQSLGLPVDGISAAPSSEASTIDASAERLADEYRRVRPRLCTTVGVRATHW